MFLSKIRLFLAFCLIGLFCINYATAQDKGIGTDELLEEYKSSKGYQELQAEMGELDPLAKLEISFRLYQKSSSGREEVTDSVDNVFLIIEQYPCNTHGANPKISHFADALEPYEFQTNIWDPKCIAVDLESEALNFSDDAEWNPEPFSSDDSEVNQQKTIELDDNYVLKAKSTWIRNKPYEDKRISGTQKGTVIGKLARFVAPSSKENAQTEKALGDAKINLPELEMAVEADQRGNFIIRDVPAGKLMKLVVESSYTNEPDTLTFVASPGKTIDLGKVILTNDN